MGGTGKGGEGRRAGATRHRALTAPSGHAAALPSTRLPTPPGCPQAVADLEDGALAAAAAARAALLDGLAAPALALADCLRSVACLRRLNLGDDEPALRAALSSSPDS